MKKKILAVVLCIVLATLAWLVMQGNVLFSSGAGLVAKHLCSLTFVSGLEFDRAREVYIDPFVEPFGPIISASKDEHGVSSRILWTSAYAEHRPGLGCTLRYDADSLESFETERRRRSFVRLADPAEVDAAFDRTALGASIAAAFEPASRGTMAVLVQQGGKVMSERYAEGVDTETPLPGWSMTKSVVATLYGVLVSNQLVDVSAPGAILEWRETSDPRSRISIDHLLRMTSGLEITEDHTGSDPNSQMLFAVADAARFAANRPLQADPGDYYEYMSGSTVLATRRIQEVFGSLEATYDFIHTRLFDQLGMSTAVMEPDESGTLIGSSFMLASARDWAQLGQLYANGGTYRGRQILPPHWVTYVTRHTPESGVEGYGAGFWLSSTDGVNGWDGVPTDAFTMNGFQGQYVVVIPSLDLVIVRLGAAPGDPGIRQLVAGVVDALRAVSREAA